MSCIICGLDSERHHIKTRGSGGTDHENNIMMLCRNHHIECHKIGLKTFVRSYNLKSYMESKNWEYFDVLGKWISPREARK